MRLRRGYGNQNLVARSKALIVGALSSVSLSLVAESSARAAVQPTASAVPPRAAPSHVAYFEKEQLELGSPLAPVTVIEYLSTTCSHCSAFDRDTWPEVLRSYVATGAVRYIIREMPTAPVAVSAAGFLLARCAGRDRYWEVVQALLQRQTEVLGAKSPAEAVTRERNIAELDADTAETCLSDPAAIEAINARRQAGIEAGIDSTPYFIVDGRPLRPGERLAGIVYEGGELSFEQFAAAVAAAGKRLEPIRRKGSRTLSPAPLVTDAKRLTRRTRPVHDDAASAAPSQDR